MWQQHHPRIPKYRLFKPKNLACVDIAGKRFYLGPYGSPGSRQLYNAYIAEWFRGGCQGPPDLTTPRRRVIDASFVPVARIAASFVRHLRAVRPLGPGRFQNFHNVMAAMRFFRNQLRYVDALTVTAHDFEKLQLAMARRGWARATIRDRMNLVRAAVRHATKARLLPKEVRVELDDIEPLPRNARSVKPSRRVPPVAEHLVEATLPHLSHVVAAMVRFQLLTAARPGEVCILRPMDLDTAGRVWTYRPSRHKNEHRGTDRLIAIGPAAQEVLRPFLAGRRTDAFVFSPAEAEAARRARLHAERKTPLHYGNRPGTNVRAVPQHRPGDRYATASYRVAIRRACESAGLDPWHPNQLRHTAATRLRREAGLEVAAIALGHSSATLTDQVYAERDLQKLYAVVQNVG